MAAYEVLLLNTAVPQIQAAQAGDTYVVPRDIAFSTVASFAAGAEATPSIVATGDTNTGIWFPAADTVAISTGGTSRLRLDSSGNLGLGVTPSGWNTYTAFQVLGGSVSNYNTDDNTIYASNIYYGGSPSAFRYVKTGQTGTMYRQNTGAHTWHTTGTTTGTANAEASALSQAMTLDASGNWQLGTTTAYNANGFGRHANIRGTSNAVLYIGNNSAEANCMQLGWTATESYVGNLTSLPLVFLINNLEKARITSGGYFKASNSGNYVGVAGTYHEMVSDGTTNTLVVRNSNTATVDDGTVFISNARNTTNNTYYILSAYNTTASAFKFRVADSGDVTNTNGTYGTIPSERRFKQDIIDAPSQWDDIKNIRLRKFRLKSDVERDGDAALVQLGVIVDELEQVSPGLIDEHPIYEDREVTDDAGNVTKERVQVDTVKGWKTSIVHLKALKALQEAMARIEKLEAEVAALKGA